jgi:hypothetical protein
MRALQEAAPAAPAPANIRERWNIERDGDDLLVCFNNHEKGETCEYERFVRAPAAPAPAAAPSEWKLVQLEPTKEMIEDGAQRLVSWEDGCTWPDSWSGLQVAAARNEAERVWRSMWLAAAPAAPAPLTDEQIVAAANEAFDTTIDLDDETLVNKYGHGVYISRFIDFARAIERAAIAASKGGEA